MMATKTERLEARVARTDRELIELAASSTGESVSAFMVGAAVGRAEEVLAEATTTTVPADYFDALMAALDEADAAPGLVKIAEQANRRQRIRSR